jgi:hypothetical protein
VNAKRETEVRLTMELMVLVGTSFGQLVEIQRAVETINQVQTRYRLSIGMEAWIKDGKENKIIDYDLLLKEKEKRYRQQPVIIVTENPLKFGWTAYDRPNMYIFTTDGHGTRYQKPPLKIFLMYFVAGILGTFDSRITEEVNDSTMHQGRPIGCISDLCEEEEDFFISMKKAHICRQCKRIYEENGLSKEGMVAIQKVLAYVKEQASKYDRRIPYDVFISYSHKDKQFVAALTDLLESKRLKVWYDDFSILPGDSIIEKLARGIENSKCFVVVLSPDFVRSGWCKSELSMAINLALGTKSKRRVKLLPVLYKKCNIPLYLRPYKYADLQTENFQKGFSEILDTLRVKATR